MYEKDGEKYFIVDEHQHFWNAGRDNWVEGRENLREGLDRLLLRLPPARPARDPLGRGEVPQGGPSRTTSRTCSTRATSTTRSSSRPTSSTGTRRASTPSSATARSPRRTPTRSSSTAAGTRGRARRGSSSSRRTPRSWNFKGVKLYTAEWHETARAAGSSTSPRPYRVPGEVPGAGHQEHPRRTRARRSGRWTRTRSTSRTSTTPRPTSRTSTSSSSTSACRGSRTSAYMAVQEPNVYAGLSVVIGAPHARPAEVLREGHGRAAVLGRRGPADLRQRLQHLDAEVAGRGLRRLADARRRGVHRLPAAHDRHQEEDPRPQRGEALRHRGARRVPAARARRSTAQREHRAARRAAAHRRRPPRGPRRDDRARRDAVWQALDTVLDPELDEPITDLDFVASCTVSGRTAWRPSGCGCRRSSARRTSPSSWSPTPTTRCRRCRG